MRTLLTKNALTVLLLLAALGLLAVACGGNDDGEGDPLVLDAVTVEHHWQALVAIRDGDLEDASHHVEHIIGSVEGAHLAAMQDIAALLAAGETHDAEHELEVMLAGQADGGLTREALHLQMAVEALTLDDATEAVHHIGHFIAAVPDSEANDGTEVLALLAAGDVDEAKQRLTALIAEFAEHDDAHVDDDHEEDDGDMRTIRVVMNEFSFDPDEIRVKVGERVRLLLVNEGAVLHDITTDDFQGTAESTGDTVHGHDDRGSADANDFHAALESGGTSELEFVAEAAGTFELFCSVPGHRQAGMTATLIVEEG